MMELYILDKDTRQMIGMVDGYESVIWTKRYFEPGDFEIYIRATQRNMELLSLDNFVMRYDDDMVGIIEKVQIIAEQEKGDYIVVSGRCIKSLLGRRIIWKMTNVKGTTEECIRKIVTDNLIVPEIEMRTMPGFVLGKLQGYGDTLEAQYTGDNLLEVITMLCKQYGYGFNVFLNDSLDFVFQLYKGVNHSYSQDINPYVVFSPLFENIVTSTYEHDRSGLKNACNVAGEGEGTERKTYAVGTSAGMERRELFVDARDLSSTVDDKTITTVEYNNMLIARGEENLSENAETHVFEGEVETIRQYKYKRDWDIGDIVTIQNQYGVTGNPRIIEVIETMDGSGYAVSPTFEEMEGLQ